MRFAIRLLPVFTLVLFCGNAAAYDYVTRPDGRRVVVVGPNDQVDLSSLRSGVRGEAVDRRFDMNQAFYLANELYYAGTVFFMDATRKKLPIAHDQHFSFLTNVEAYWYSRYNLISASARARAGIGVVHGPYVEERAKQLTALNEFGRDRGELAVANKDALLTDIQPPFLERTAWPEKFDNAVPLMLEFKSADPHLVFPLDLEQDATGRARYLNDFETLRWNHDRMDVAIDLGAVGQALLKKVLWCKFFMQRTHQEPDFPGETFLGINAEDGFRGATLTLEAVSTLLMAKAALFTDPSKREFHWRPPFRRPRLTGIDPFAYDPSRGVRYLPHEIHPTLVHMPDIPVRHYDLAVQDAASRLWDQASWLWGVTEFFDYANPRKRDAWDLVFSPRAPHDGGIMEQKYALLAQGLAGVLLANLEAMHQVDGILVSEWSPEHGSGSFVTLADLGLAMNALSNYVQVMDLEPQRRLTAEQMLRRQADFLLQAAGKDGLYRTRYRVPGKTAEGEPDMTSQAFAIRGLLAAYQATGEERYAEAARKAGRVWNERYWDEKAWLYRNRPGEDLVVYTPVDVGVALGALRELVLLDGDPELLERFKRFFVQALDASGMMQAEDLFTGEKIEEVRAGNLDSDGDGIPFMSGGHGRHGIDTVAAARVEIDLSRSFEPPAPEAEPLAPPSTGVAIFALNCAICHGAEGKGHECPSLVDSALVRSAGTPGVAAFVRAGSPATGMPAWEGLLSEEEIKRIADYVGSLPGK